MLQPTRPRNDRKGRPKHVVRGFSLAHHHPGGGENHSVIARSISDEAIPVDEEPWDGDCFAEFALSEILRSLRSLRMTGSEGLAKTQGGRENQGSYPPLSPI